MKRDDDYSESANSAGDEDIGLDDATNQAVKKVLRRKQVECIIGDKTPEELRAKHPQRSTHHFTIGKSPVTITSDFDAGNMSRCEQHSDQPNHVSYVASNYF